MSIRSSHIVLLGATGFLGRALREELQRQGRQTQGFGSTALDLRADSSLRVLERAVTPETTLIMAAAITRDRSDAMEAFDANVVMAAHAAQLLRRRRILACVYVSSDAVYGDHRTNLAITEETPPSPVTLYAASKLAGESLFRVAAEAAATPLAILRPCRVYGPGDPHLTYGPARFIRTAIERGTIELRGGGEERRPLLFVRDFAKLVARFADGDLAGIYNVAGESVSFAELAGLIAGQMGSPMTIRQTPRDRPITHLGYDTRKLQAACPDLPPTPLEEGLKATIDAARGVDTRAMACGR